MKKIFYFTAVIFAIISLFMMYKGYDKMTNYYNSEDFSIFNENAYVGGDAYNYIINGTYSTSYFTLASGFLVSSVLCVIGGTILDKEKVNAKTNNTKLSDSEDTLPPM